MGHFAELDQSNTVIRVLVGDETAEGADFLKRLGGTWLQTSYNTRAGQHLAGGTPLRKNYAGIGYTYDAVRDAFIPPKPFASWVLNEETACWDAPVAYPTGTDVMHFWDEGSVSWQAVG